MKRQRVKWVWKDGKCESMGIQMEGYLMEAYIEWIYQVDSYQRSRKVKQVGGTLLITLVGIECEGV